MVVTKLSLAFLLFIAHVWPVFMAKSEAATQKARSTSNLMAELEKALNEEKSKVSETLELAERAEQIAKQEELRLREETNHFAEMRQVDLEKNKDCRNTLDHYIRLATLYQRKVAGLLLLHEDVMSRLKNASFPYGDLRALYQDEALQQEAFKQASQICASNELFMKEVENTSVLVSSTVTDLLPSLNLSSAASEDVRRRLLEAPLRQEHEVGKTLLALILCTAILLWIYKSRNKFRRLKPSESRLRGIQTSMSLCLSITYSFAMLYVLIAKQDPFSGSSVLNICVQSIITAAMVALAFVECLNSAYLSGLTTTQALKILTLAGATMLQFKAMWTRGDDNASNPAALGLYTVKGFLATNYYFYSRTPRVRPSSSVFAGERSVPSEMPQKGTWFFKSIKET